MKSSQVHLTIFTRFMTAVVFFHLIMYGIVAALLVRGKSIGLIREIILSAPAGEAAWPISFLLLLMAVFMALSLGFSFFIAFRYLFKPMQEACEQTMAISRNILGEDFIDTDNRKNGLPDFRRVMEAVNNGIHVLRERGALLHAIVEGIPAMVYYVDADYRVLWANGMAKQRVPDLVGLDLKNAKTGFFENERELLQSAFAKRTIQTVNACYLKNEGIQECWEHVAVPVRNDPRGETTVIIRICRDITDKRRAEEELRRLNETLERRVEAEILKREEGERIAEQQSRLAALGELATGMAHEITQPLHTVLFSVENIRNRFDSGKLDASYLHNKIKSVESDIDRIRRVIEHMRLFARGTPNDFPVAFSVNRCVENALSMIGVQLATHGIDTFLNLTDPLPNIVGNPFQYEQVVLNLLSNARDAIEERLIRDAQSNISDSVPGKIWITSVLREKKIILTIEDNGTGIPEGIETRVFDPFFTTKASGKGTGLGLSISYGIIREMGGIITLERRDHGVCIRIVTPLGPGREGEHETT